MSSVNIVTLSGRIARPPKRVRDPNNDNGYVHVFPLAVREGNQLVFPVVVVRSRPEFVTYHDDRKLHEQPLVTVIGRIRTRNLTQPLAEALAAQARRASAPQEVIAAIQEQLDNLGLQARRVVTEVMADSIHEGGAW